MKTTWEIYLRNTKRFTYEISFYRQRNFWSTVCLRVASFLNKTY